MIGFDENERMTQPYEFNDAKISCQYPCGTEISLEVQKKADFYHCCYTTHGKHCDQYDLSKCE